jgi:hypothetical protein
MPPPRAFQLPPIGNKCDSGLFLIPRQYRKGWLYRHRKGRLVGCRNRRRSVEAPMRMPSSAVRRTVVASMRKRRRGGIAADVWREWPDILETTRFRMTRVVLPATHLDGDPANNRLKNLCTLWQRMPRPARAAVPFGAALDQAPGAPGSRRSFSRSIFGIEHRTAIRTFGQQNWDTRKRRIAPFQCATQLQNGLYVAVNILAESVLQPNNRRATRSGLDSWNSPHLVDRST